MKAKIKIWLRRYFLRACRAVLDLADDRLHAAEVRFRERNEIRRDSSPCAPDALASRIRVQDRGHRQGESFVQWEARRSGVAVVSKKQARARRHTTAADFDSRWRQWPQERVTP